MKDYLFIKEYIVLLLKRLHHNLNRSLKFICVQFFISAPLCYVIIAHVFCVFVLSDMESEKHLRNYSPKPEVYFPNILSPVIRTPVTDLFGSVINHQQYGRCTRFEMNMMECLEAYGLDKGKVKCVDLIDDFNECHYSTKQYLRHMVKSSQF